MRHPIANPPRILCLLGTMFLCFAGGASGAEEPKPLFVEGYAGHVSYAPGEDLTLHVSTSAAKFSVEIARLGAKSESVWSSASVAGREHP